MLSTQRPRRLFVAAVALLCAGSSRAVAAADNGGSDAGHTHVNGFVTDAAELPDGRQLVLGTVDDPYSVPFVERRLPSGSSDVAFGSRGRVELAEHPNRLFLTSIGTDGQGRAVVAGELEVGGTCIMDRGCDMPVELVRLTSAGEVDPTFGADGWAQGLDDGTTSSIAALRVFPDGTITVVVTTFLPGLDPGQARIERFLANGSHDPTYADDGTLVVQDLSPSAASIGEDGTVLLAGARPPTAPGTFDTSVIVVTRITADGHEDATYGHNGLATLALGQPVSCSGSPPGQTPPPPKRSEGADAISGFPDSRAVVMATVENSSCSGDITAVGLTASGAPDADAPARVVVPTTTDFPCGVTVTPNGKLVMGFGGPSRSPWLRLNRDLTEDASFGGAAWLCPLRIDGDGRIFTAVSDQLVTVNDGPVLNRAVVGMAARPTGDGYWLVAADGGIFSFGDAPFHGSAGGMRLNQPVVGMAATPDGGGYWLVARDGGIFSFGDATFYGSTGAMRLNKPIVGMAATPTGRGYWLVAADGGIFTFGDAPFYGSAANSPGAEPVVAMAATTSGHGYWLATADGTILTYGDATFLAGEAQTAPITGIAVTPDGHGAWLVTANGGVVAVGDAQAVSPAGPADGATHAIGIAASGPGMGYWTVTATGIVRPFGTATAFGFG